MKIQPTHDFVLVRRVRKEEEATPSGLVVIDGRLDCEVLAVGPGRFIEYVSGPMTYASGNTTTTIYDGAQGPRFAPMPCKVGDVVVLVSQHVGIDVAVKGERFLLVRADDIAGIMEAS